MSKTDAEKNLKEVYDKAMKRLAELATEQQKIISEYLKGLEEEKIKNLTNKLKN